MRPRAHLKRFRSGNAVLEMVLVLPALIFVGMGVAEFGQYMYVENLFESAARDVARYSVPTTAVQGDPVTAATRTLAQANIAFNASWMTIYDDGNSFAVVTDVSQVKAGNAITVVIQVPYYLVPHVYRPLYQITGVGIGNGKVVMGKSTGVKE